MTSIPLLNLQAVHEPLRGEFEAAIADVLSRGDFIRGEATKRFERHAAEYLGVRNAIGVASGSDALTLALMAAGVGPGDEVITTAFSFWATAEAIYHTGAVPVYADIRHQDMCLDPLRIEAAITPRTRAILPVHIFGHGAPMPEINTIAERHNLAVIEDCAQAFGSVYRGQALGSFGSAGCFSFYPSKPLGGLGDGGLVVSNDDELIECVRRLSDHGRREAHLHDCVGYNSRLDTLQAALLDVKLNHFAGHLAERRRVAKRYLDALYDLPVTVPELDPSTCAFGQFTLRCDERDALRDYLARHGVASAVYYPVPLYRQPAHPHGDMYLPETERACRGVLSLPLFVGMSATQQQRVIDLIAAFFNAKEHG